MPDMLQAVDRIPASHFLSLIASRSSISDDTHLITTRDGQFWLTNMRDFHGVPDVVEENSPKSVVMEVAPRWKTLAAKTS